MFSLLTLGICQSIIASTSFDVSFLMLRMGIVRVRKFELNDPSVARPILVMMEFFSIFHKFEK